MRSTHSGSFLPKVASLIISAALLIDPSLANASFGQTPTRGAIDLAPYQACALGPLEIVFPFSSLSAALTAKFSRLFARHPIQVQLPPGFAFNLPADHPLRKSGVLTVHARTEEDVVHELQAAFKDFPQLLNFLVTPAGQLRPSLGLFQNGNRLQAGTVLSGVDSLSLDRASLVGGSDRGSLWDKARAIRGNDIQSVQDRAFLDLVESFRRMTDPVPAALLRAAFQRDAASRPRYKGESFDFVISDWRTRHLRDRVVENLDTPFNEFVLAAYKSAFPERDPIESTSFSVSFHDATLQPDNDGMVRFSLLNGQQGTPAGSSFPQVVIDPRSGYAFFVSATEAITAVNLKTNGKVEFGTKAPTVVFSTVEGVSRIHGTVIAIWEGHSSVINVTDGDGTQLSKNGLWPDSAFVIGHDQRDVRTELEAYHHEKERVRNLPEFVRDPRWRTFIEGLLAPSAEGTLEQIINARLELGETLAALGLKESPGVAFVNGSGIREDSHGVLWVDDAKDASQDTLWEKHLLTQSEHPEAYLFLPIALSGGRTVTLIPRRLFLKLTWFQQFAVLRQARQAATHSFGAVEEHEGSELLAAVQMLQYLSQPPEDPVNQEIAKARLQLVEIKDWTNPQSIKPVRDAVEHALGVFAVAEPEDSRSKGVSFPERLDEKLISDLLNTFSRSNRNDKRSSELHFSLTKNGSLGTRAEVAGRLVAAMNDGLLPKVTAPAKEKYDAHPFTHQLHARDNHIYEIPFQEVRLPVDKDVSLYIFVGNDGWPHAQRMNTQTGRPKENPDLLGVGDYVANNFQPIQRENARERPYGFIHFRVTQNEHGQYVLHYSLQSGGSVHWNDAGDRQNSEVFLRLAKVREILDKRAYGHEFYNEPSVKRSRETLHEELAAIDQAATQGRSSVDGDSLSLFKRATAFNDGLEARIQQQKRRMGIEEKLKNRAARKSDKNRGTLSEQLSALRRRVWQAGKIKGYAPDFVEGYKPSVRYPSTWAESTVKTTISDLENKIYRDHDRLHSQTFRAREAEVASLIEETDAVIAEIERTAHAAKAYERAAEIDHLLWDIRFVEDPANLEQNRTERAALTTDVKKLKEDILAHRHDANIRDADAEADRLDQSISALYASAGSTLPRPVRTIPADIRHDIQKLYSQLHDDDLFVLFRSRGTYRRVLVLHPKTNRAIEEILESRDALRHSVNEYMRLTEKKSIFGNTSNLTEGLERIHQALRVHARQVDYFKNGFVDRDYFREPGASSQLEYIEENLQSFYDVLGGEKPQREHIVRAYELIARHRPDLSDATLSGVTEFETAFEAKVALNVWEHRGYDPSSIKINFFGGMILPDWVAPWYRPVAHKFEFFLGLAGTFFSYAVFSHFQLPHDIAFAFSGSMGAAILALLHVPMNVGQLKHRPVQMMLLDTAVANTAVLGALLALTAGSIWAFPAAVIAIHLSRSLWTKHRNLNLQGSYSLDPLKALLAPARLPTRQMAQRSA